MNLAVINFSKCFLILLFLFTLSIQSCTTQSPEEFAKKWTNEIKAKVIEDASQQPDKTVFDTIHHETTLFKNGKVLKHFYFTSRVDAKGDEIKVYDTARILFYSTDQNFQYVQEPCIQGKERSYEGVTYQLNRYGAAKYVYCRKKLIETGFHFKNLNVGTWITYDSTGKNITEQIDAGKADELKKLKDLKYYR